MLFRGIRGYLQRNDRQGAVVFIDQEKAFDRVSWAYRDRVLLAMGFGPLFRSIVSLAHADISATVLVNGFRSNGFTITRGTRQGDPFSPGLYALMDEPLACALRACEDFRGIEMPVPAYRRPSSSRSTRTTRRSTSPVLTTTALPAVSSPLREGLWCSRQLGQVESAPPRHGDSGRVEGCHRRPLMAGTDTTKYLGLQVGPQYGLRRLDPSHHQDGQDARPLEPSRPLHPGTPDGDQDPCDIQAVVRGSRDAHLSPTTAQIETKVWRFLWKDKRAGPVSRPSVSRHAHTADSLRCLSPRWSSPCTWCGSSGSSTRADSKWKDLVHDELRESAPALARGLGLRVLWSPPTPCHPAQHPLALLGLVVKSAQQLHLHEAEPTDLFQVLRQGLVRNPCLRSPRDDSLLDDQPVRALAQRGISTVGHLLRRPQDDDDIDCELATAADLGVSARVLARIHAAIPQQWRDIIDNGFPQLAFGQLVAPDRSLPPRHVWFVDNVVRSDEDTPSSSSTTSRSCKLTRSA